MSRPNSILPKNATVFDPAIYPRIYETSTARKMSGVLLGVFGVILGLLFVSIASHPSNYDVPRSSGENAFVFIFGVLLGIMGIYVAILRIKLRVTLLSDAIEVSGLFRTRRLFRNEIEGIRRSLGHRGPDTLQFIPKSSGTKKIVVQKILKTDAAFDAWVDSLADLDRRDMYGSMVEMANDQNFGRTIAEKMSHLDNANRFSRAVAGASYITCFWAFIYPEPYDILALILVSIPLISIAVAARSKGMLRFCWNKNDAHPSLLAAVIFPGLGLALCTFQNIDLVSWYQPLLPAVLLGIISVFLIYKIDTLARTKSAIAGILFMMSVYGYGATVYINAQFDVAMVELKKVTVLCKSFSRGKRPVPQLTLSAPPSSIASPAMKKIREDASPASCAQSSGGGQETETIVVTSTLYNRVNLGEPLCKYLHKGILGVDWYKIDVCN